MRAGKKRSILLSVKGSSSYKRHHNQVPSEIVQRYKFTSRFCWDGESVATFVSKLYSPAEFSNYGASLNDMLWDRLVCIINADHIQWQLLSSEKKAMKIHVAVALETAALNAQMLQSAPQQSALSRGRAVEAAHSLQSKGPHKVLCYR